MGVKRESRTYVQDDPERVLRKIFKPKQEEVTGGWRRVHNEVRDTYSSSDIIRVIKSKNT